MMYIFPSFFFSFLIYPLCYYSIIHKNPPLFELYPSPHPTSNKIFKKMLYFLDLECWWRRRICWIVLETSITQACTTASASLLDDLVLIFLRFCVSFNFAISTATWKGFRYVAYINEYFSVEINVIQLLLLQDVNTFEREKSGSGRIWFVVCIW